ncbi:DNA-directed DNA polymerase alpha subunit pol12 [Tilletia horrida]|nr:DNA-directed DNA polymerase alpha subunit pol12 [Tilletia horrida]
MPTATAVMNAETRSSLASHFGKRILADEDLLVELASTLRLYSLSAKTLFFKYEAYAIDNDIPPGTPLTLEVLRELKNTIQRERGGSGAGGAAASAAAFATPARPGLSALGGGSAMRSAMKPSLGSMLGSGGPSATPRAGMPPNTPFTKGSAQRTAAGGAAHQQNGPMSSASKYTAFQTPSRPGQSAAAGMEGIEFDSPAPQPGKGQLLETLNPQIALQKSRLGQSTRVKLAVSVDPKLWDYRYMFEKPADKGEALDDRIDELAQLLIDHYALEDDLGDPAQQTQEDVYVVGRICPDAPANPSTSAVQATKLGDHADDVDMLTGDAESRKTKGPLNLTGAISVDASAPSNSSSASKSKQGGGAYPLLPRLTPQGIYLETSRVLGSGSRTRLVFSPTCTVKGAPPGAANPIGLFPGMIVGCKGRNVGGDSFRVEEILLVPSLPHSISNIRNMLTLQHEDPKFLQGEAAQIMIASGPYVDLNNSNDLDFAPWHKMCDWIESGTHSDDLNAEAPSRSDVLLLLGPFVPANHPALLSPTLSGLPSELFSKHIAGRLTRLGQTNPGTTVILVPSTNDICNRHTAWPQPAFEKSDEELGLPKRVKRLPNPALFTINEVTIAVSTADVLRDLKAEELVQRVSDPAGGNKVDGAVAAPKDQVARLIRHVLGQRSFYPLYPSSPASALTLDVTHSNLAIFPSVTPDVLILPSTLKSFARIIDSTVVLNPGVITAAASLASAASVAGPTAAKTEDQPVASEAQQQPVTVARMVIVPLPRDELERLESSKAVNEETGQDGEAHRVYERARVDLIQI